MTDPSQTQVQKRVLVMQLITGQLILGLAIITGILFFIAKKPQANNPDPIFSWIAVGIFLAAVSISIWVLPNFLNKKATSNDGQSLTLASNDTERWKLRILNRWQMGRLTHSALIEGAGVFGSIAYFLEGQPFTLAIPAAAIVMMILSFPTIQQAERYILSQTPR